jgi:hypothetical protein
MHIQGERRQGIESLDLRGQEMVDGVADAGVFAHDLFWRMNTFNVWPLLSHAVVATSLPMHGSHQFPLFQEKQRGSRAAKGC